ESLAQRARRARGRARGLVARRERVPGARLVRLRDRQRRALRENARGLARGGHRAVPRAGQHRAHNGSRAALSAGLSRREIATGFPERAGGERRDFRSQAREGALRKIMAPFGIRRWLLLAAMEEEERAILDRL